MKATVHYDLDEHYVYTFQGKQYWKWTLKYVQRASSNPGDQYVLVLVEGYPKQVSELNSKLEDIDEIFYDPNTSTLYIFRKWFYIERIIYGPLDVSRKRKFILNN